MVVTKINKHRAVEIQAGIIESHLTSYLISVSRLDVNKWLTCSSSAVQTYWSSISYMTWLNKTVEQLVIARCGSWQLSECETDPRCRRGMKSFTICCDCLHLGLPKPITRRQRLYLEFLNTPSLQRSGISDPKVYHHGLCTTMKPPSHQVGQGVKPGSNQRMKVKRRRSFRSWLAKHHDLGKSGVTKSRNSEPFQKPIRSRWSCISKDLHLYLRTRPLLACTRTCPIYGTWALSQFFTTIKSGYCFMFSS